MLEHDPAGTGFISSGGLEIAPEEAEVLVRPKELNFPPTREEYLKRLLKTPVQDLLQDSYEASVDFLFAGAQWLRLWSNPSYWSKDVPSGDGSPLIFVPGFGASERLYRPKVKAFQKIGYDARTFPLRYVANIEPMELMVDDLFEYLEEVKAETGSKTNVAGDSKGGLLIGVALALDPDRFKTLVDKAFFVGSPLPERVNSFIGGAYLLTQYVFGGDDFKLTRKIGDLEGLTHVMSSNITVIIAEDDLIIKEGKLFGSARNQYKVKAFHGELMFHPKTLWIMSYRLSSRPFSRVA